MFWLFGIIPLIFLLIALACFVGLVVIWVKVLRGGKLASKGDSLARCGECGYAARGAVDFACAECGADLREVGIVTASQAKPMIGPLAFIAFWTVCLPIPGFTASGFLIAAGPKHQFVNEDLNLAPLNSGEYLSLDLYVDNSTAWASTLWAGSAYMSTDPLNINIAGNNSQYEWFTVDPVAMTYDTRFVSFTVPTATASANASPPTSTTPSSNTTPGSTTPSNPIPSSPSPSSPSPNPNPNQNQQAVLSGQPSPSPLDAPVLLAFMQSAGVDITKPEVIAEADELLQIIRDQPTQGLVNVSPTQFNVTHSSSYTTDLPKGWWVALTLLAVPAVWIAGIVLYFLIRRRRSTMPALKTRDSHGPARFAPPSP